MFDSDHRAPSLSSRCTCFPPRFLCFSSRYPVCGCRKRTTRQNTAFNGEEKQVFAAFTLRTPEPHTRILCFHTVPAIRAVQRG